MPEIKRTFLVDSDGVYASVPAGEVDTYIPLGWATAGEPSGDAFVWLEHETTGGKARFPLAVLPQWQVLGWQPGAPPKPVDTLRDPQLVASDAVDASQDDAKPTKTAIAAKKEQ
jgi:hypothetical protein